MPYFHTNSDSKVHGANIGSTWVLSAPDGPYVGPMNLAIREACRLGKGETKSIFLFKQPQCIGMRYSW